MMKNLLAFMLLIHGPIWVFYLPVIDARPDPIFSPLSAPGPSPAVAPIPSILASMDAFSPGELSVCVNLCLMISVFLFEFRFSDCNMFFWGNGLHNFKI